MRATRRRRSKERRERCWTSARASSSGISRGDSQHGVIQVTVRVQVRQYIDNPWAALFIRVEDFDSYVSIGVSHCAMSSNEANV
jgi:hypothetical protein